MTAEQGLHEIELVEVRPLGDVPLARLDGIVRRLSRHVGAPCHVVPGVAVGDLPRMAHRPQLHADETLALLDEQPLGPGAVTIGVTAEDLGHPLFTFFFGRARMGGAALVSLHRLDPRWYGLPADEDVLQRRAVLECLHELGHVAGLRHCADHACVMHFSGDVESIDLRGGGFCVPCGQSVPRGLRHAIGAGRRGWAAGSGRS